MISWHFRIFLAKIQKLNFQIIYIYGILVSEYWRANNNVCLFYLYFKDVNLMALFTKSILAAKSPNDGLRISVMSRHTLNDGVTPHPQIDESSYDKWLKELAPDNKLIGAYYKKGLSWGEFTNNYIAFLRESPQSYEVRKLAKQALEQDITVMCVEESPEYCHRRLLAEECQRVEPKLKISVS